MLKEAPRIGYSINPYSRIESRQVVLPFLAKKGANTVDIYSNQNIEQLPDKLLVVGGEGTNRELMQKMFDLEQIRPVGIVGGGTKDVLYQFLVATGRIMTVEEFESIPSDQFPERFIYRPGMVSDETGKTKIIFNNQFGVGNFDTAHGIIHEWLRGFPPKVRSMGSTWLATIPAILKEGKIVDLYSVASNIGEVDAFPHQDQYGDFVTHATTNGSLLFQANSRWVVQDSMKHNRIPPQENLWIDQGRIFSLRNRFKYFWVDGDTINNPLVGNSIIIGRAEVGIPLVAIR